MIDSLDVLRHGWLDATSTLAPDQPEVADVLRAGLENAATRGEIDEPHLFQVIDEAASVAAGSDNGAAEALARRLRRSVYEYLLALDAVAPQETNRFAFRSLPSTGEALIGADEIAAIEASLPSPDHAPPEVTTHGGTSADGAEEQTLSEPVVSPLFDEADPVDRTHEESLVTDDGDDDHEPLWRLDPIAEPADGVHPAPFVVPRDGFHIVEDTHPAHVPRSGDDGPPMSMPPLSFDEAQATDEAGPVREPEEETLSSVLTGAPSDEEFDAAVPEASAQKTEHEAEAAPVGGPGWRVRDPSSPTQPPPRSETPTAAVGDAAVSNTTMDNPFETDAELQATRKRIDDRLRRKRCDEAAAMLQQLAQDVGSRVVAELALDAGDRCRALGKANAALNCYLAASRADPVYEVPLGRLADICLDDQDIELAVSYLERIARLSRLRGDDRGALRVYRKIATVAPYRDDVLEALTRAERTGRLDV